MSAKAPARPVVSRTSGAGHFCLALRLTWVSWLLLAALQLALFMRPTPYGAAYVLDPWRYLPQAVFYELLGVLLLASPFLTLWLARYGRSEHDPRWRLVPLTQALLLATNLLANAADHELVRFMGLRLTPSFIATYLNTHSVRQPQVADALWLDRGGAGLAPVLTFGVPLLFLAWAVREIARLAVRTELRPPRPLVAIVLATAPLLITGSVRLLPGAQFRTHKVQPVLLTLITEWASGDRRPLSGEERRRLATLYQERWIAGSADRAWRFADPTHPYLRTPLPVAGRLTRAGAAEGVERPWNVLYLQLETLRGWDVGFLHPERPDSPTPFLDAFARDPASAYWTRCSSFGPPTVNNVLAAHCSLLPHTRRYLTTSHTTLRLLALPEVLRAHGFVSEVSAAADPDWDGERVWFARWYDRVEYDPSLRDRDRLVFRRAAARLRELGAAGRPFFVTLVSAANHYPFRSVEAAFGVGAEAPPNTRLQGTMRYTDDVVRELVESLRTEPWFARTLVVIAGDHGYNLGEHDGRPGQVSLSREALWVPLIIHASHPGLPRGPQTDVASLIDIAPTVAELLGLREENPWMGTSLVAGPRPSARLSFVLGERAYDEAGREAVLTDAQSGETQAFDVLADPGQRAPLPLPHVGLERRLDEARALAALHDTLIETDTIWR